MRNYYSENTDQGIRIVISDKNDEFIGFEETGDLPAILLVLGFVVFLFVII